MLDKSEKGGELGSLRASMVVRDEEEERRGKEAPGGGSVRRSLSSFCNRRLSLAA